VPISTRPQTHSLVSLAFAPLRYAMNYTQVIHIYTSYPHVHNFIHKISTQ